MKWKKEVYIKKNEEGVFINFEKNKKKVPEKELYLIQTIEQGITDDDILLELIKKVEGINTTLAALLLSQYILDYREYLEEDNSFYEIR